MVKVPLPALVTNIPELVSKLILPTLLPILILAEQVLSTEITVGKVAPVR